MKKVTVTSGQSLLDMALQEYGCEEGIVLLAYDNDLAIDADLLPGQTLLIQNEVPALSASNKLVAAYFVANQIRVNTGWNRVQTATPTTSFYDNNFYNNEFFD